MNTDVDYLPPEISRRDFFAATAPKCTAEEIDFQSKKDRAANPYNEPHKKPLRSTIEIQAQWAYKWADAMIKASEQDANERP